MKQRMRTVSLGSAAVFLLLGCAILPASPTPLSLEELIAIVENPASSHDDFAYAMSELIEMGPAAAPAVPVLARAMAYSRRDAPMAGQVLMLMGPVAAPAIPQLVSYLDAGWLQLRLDAVAALGAIGPSARCSAPLVAARLWDEDSAVRTAAAWALERLGGVDLVESLHEIDASSGVDADDPEGYLSGKARTWWQETGQYLDWSGEPNPCDVEE